MPPISANTQARLEGCFRREWKLAVNRTHDKANAKPFLVPVCIGDTRDADAHVCQLRETATQLKAAQTSDARSAVVPER